MVIKDSFSTNSMRLLYGSWMFVSLILANIYSSTFYSILTITEYEHPIDSVEDLFIAATQDTHWIYIANRTFFNTLVNKATPQDGLIWQIKQHISRSGRPMLARLNQIIPIIEKNAKSVAIGIEATFHTIIALFASQPEQFHISSEPIESAYIAWPLSKKSPLKYPFNRM